MKNKKLNFIVYPHAVLFLWAVLFIISLQLSDGGEIASVLAFGNPLFLFVNIPFSLFSLILKAKSCFSKKYGVPIVVLSILNIIVGIMAWSFVVILLQSPKFQ